MDTGSKTRLKLLVRRERYCKERGQKEACKRGVRKRRAREGVERGVQERDARSGTTGCKVKEK